jgi:hypothetical protein
MSDPRFRPLRDIVTPATVARAIEAVRQAAECHQDLARQDWNSPESYGHRHTAAELLRLAEWLEHQALCTAS